MRISDIKAVVFDMDGVILDSETVSVRTWRRAAAELRVGRIETAIRDCMGASLTDTVAILKSQYGADFDAEAFLNRASQLFHETEASEGIPLMPYAAETLSALKGRYRLALASSTAGAAVRRQLSAAGVLHFFETVTTGDMVEHSKPDPEIYEKACRSLGLPCAECAAVEDSFNGVRSAAAAGLFTVMIPDKLPPDAEIRALARRIYGSLAEMGREFAAGR